MNLQTQTLKSCHLEEEKVISAVYHPVLEVYMVNTERKIMAVNNESEIVAKQRIVPLLEAKHIILVPMEDGY